MVKRIKIDEKIKQWNAANPDKRQLSRELLAEKVGCSYSLVNNLQSGKVGKGVQLLNKFAETLECTIDELIEK